MLSPRVVVRLAIWGFFLGLAVVLLTSVTARGWGGTSVKRLIALVAVASFLCWFASRILVGLVAS